MTRTLLAAFRRGWFVAALTGGFLGFPSALLRADYVVNNFDSADELNGWYLESWSSAGATASWDPTTDAQNDPASGSMKIVIDFDATNGKNDANFSHVLPAAVDASQAFLFIADVRVADESPDTPWGDEGYMQIVARNADNWDWIAQIASNINSHGAWVPFDVTPTGPVDSVRAVTLQLWGGGAQNLHGQTTMWIDNLRFLGDIPDPDPTQVGDTDGDLDVDLDDLNNVRNNFGSAEPPIGDTDGDSDVDLDDLNAVRNNFGVSASQTVPEPSTAALCIFGVLSLATLRLRNRRK